MRKIYILLLFVLISILPLVFSLEIPFTLENDEYNYNFTSKIMTDNNGIEYKVATNGVIEINNERFLVFAIKGTIGETEIIKTSLDYNWTWHINQTGNDYIFWAENNDANLIWRQYFYFYEDPFREMKIENYVENNYSTSTDTTFYYIFNVLGSDNIEFNGTRYNLSDHIGFSKTGNLTIF